MRSYFKRCGVWLLQWSLSQLLLLYKDVPQVFIYLQRKRRNEKGNEIKSQTSIWCTLKVNSESVLKTWKTDSKKAHIKQKIVCHHHLHPSTTEAKYKYTIEPIYRTQLNSDASTGLKVCFYCFQRIWPSTLRNDRGYTWSQQPFPPAIACHASGLRRDTIVNVFPSVCL